MIRAVPRRRIAGVFAAAVLASFSGCSSDEKKAPESIEGKTPADYREEAEKGAMTGVPAAPKAAGKAKSR